MAGIHCTSSLPCLSAQGREGGGRARGKGIGEGGGGGGGGAAGEATIYGTSSLAMLVRKSCTRSVLVSCSARGVSRGASLHSSGPFTPCP